MLAAYGSWAEDLISRGVARPAGGNVSIQAHGILIRIF